MYGKQLRIAQLEVKPRSILLPPKPNSAENTYLTAYTTHYNASHKYLRQKCLNEK